MSKKRQEEQAEKEQEEQEEQAEKEQEEQAEKEQEEQADDEDTESEEEEQEDDATDDEDTESEEEEEELLECVVATPTVSPPSLPITQASPTHSPELGTVSCESQENLEESSFPKIDHKAIAESIRHAFDATTKRPHDTVRDVVQDLVLIVLNALVSNSPFSSALLCPCAF